ncbi:DUF805 domain-containing protein [soil metagenome]
MFRHPFSIKGRITRTEFGLSLLIYTAGLLVIFMAIIFIDIEIFSQALLILLLPVYWFRIAQGVKRCHDTGVSGWYQFIPFYTFVIIFESSKYGPNQYGPNPKGLGNVDEIDQIGSELK